MFPIRVADYAKGRGVTCEVVAEYLERVHLGHAAADNEVVTAHVYATVGLEANFTPEDRMRLMLETAMQAAAILAGMNWSVESDRKRRLITSDVPLVPWKPPSPSDKSETFGVADADEVRFALGPGSQLVLSRRATNATARMSAERVRSCNADVGDGARDFVVGSPDAQSALEAVHLAKRGPVLRFESARAFMIGPDGRKRRAEGEVARVWTPRR
jgi:hypothetical protein